MKKVDVAMLILFVVINVVLFFFRGCNWCLWVLLLAAIVALVVSISLYVQHKKLKDLTDEENASTANA